MARQNSTISIIGLVIGVLSILLSIIPCIGTLGALLGIVGIILGIIGIKDSKNKETTTTVAIIAIILSSIALLVGGAQALFLGKAGSNYTSVEYANCEDLLTDWDATVTLMEDIKSTPEDEASFGMVKELINMATKVAAIKAQSEQMECESDPAFKEKFDAISDRMEEIE